MPVLSPAACILCRAENAECVLSFDEPDRFERAVGLNGADYARSWVRCAGCGFYYSRYSRPAALLDRLYEEAYRDASSGWRGGATTKEIFERVIRLPFEESETKQRIGWIKATLKDLRAGGFILRGEPPWRMADIGGATGVFAYEFRDAQWTSSVVDPAREGVFLTSEYGIGYVARPYEAGLFGGPLDLISLVYALEHMRDPAGILRTAHDDLKPDGVLFIEVPDAVAFSLKPPEDDIFNSCHLWMFDPETIIALLARVRFEVLAIRRVQTARGHYGLMVLARPRQEPYSRQAG